jgi:NAD(P)-dependent dehydrogenase (short-subunit alcohol dehydrogenase family)
MTPIFPDLREASVLITGGGSGIGACLTDGFLAQGARVAFIDIVDGAAFVEAMRAKHGRAPLWLDADLRDVAAIERSVEAARRAHGPIAKLVCNAARDSRTALGSVDPELWDDLQSVNLRHCYFTAQACAEDLKATPGAAIVNFSSTSFMIPNPGMEVYMAAKSGIIGLTRGQARDLGPFGVRANCIAPGWVMTERQRKLWATPEAVAEHLRRQCVPREIAPEEMAGPCLFLASEAASAMTAQTVIVDLGSV